MPTTETHQDNHTKPARQRHIPSYLHDYVCNSPTSHKEPSPSGTPYPIDYLHYFDHLSPS